MDLDDLGELDGSSQANTRTTKFAPKSSKFAPKLKSTSKPKPEPSSKQEPQDSAPKPQPPPVEAVSKKKENDEEDVKPPMVAEPKAEQSISNGALYVLQYPLRPCWRPYELDERCKEVRVKPDSGEVEIDMSVDVDSNNYDSESANKLKRRSRTLSSSWLPPGPSAMLWSFNGLQLIRKGLRDLALSQSTLPKADARLVVKAAYGADAPEHELQDVVSQVAVELHGGLFVMKSSQENPECDPLREVVINLLRVKDKLKKAEVTAAAQVSLKRDITNNEYNKVMSDFCEYKGNWWVLKSGDGKPS
ncbi:hypothetical protein GOBAR_DD22081 [Gossypium barbadense]|nr:hypothetical protein GOBAR_DD22081 [Gossypium barbadense]